MRTILFPDQQKRKTYKRLLELLIIPNEKKMNLSKNKITEAMKVFKELSLIWGIKIDGTSLKQVHSSKYMRTIR